MAYRTKFFKRHYKSNLLLLSAFIGVIWLKTNPFLGFGGGQYLILTFIHLEIRQYTFQAALIILKYR